MLPNPFKINDKVIGLKRPDLVPAKVVGIHSEKWVYIEFKHKDRLLKRLVSIDRIKIDEQANNRKAVVQGCMGESNRGLRGLQTTLSFD